MIYKIHDVNARDSRDRFFLVVAFLVGAGGTIALKFMAVPVLLVATFPVVVLLVYVAGCFTTQSLSIEPEAVGDNCYYLGFLFTLTSLAVTLYQIRDVTGAGSVADDDLIPLVISGFGIALSSTIAGVFLRIMLMQIRPDITAQDRETRLDLAHAARDFRTSLAEVSRGIKVSAIEGNQRTAERNEKIEATTLAHVEMSSKMLQKQGEAFDSELKIFTQRLSGELEKTIRSEVLGAVASIKQPIDEMSESLARLSKLRETSEVQIREAVDLLSCSMQDLGQAIKVHQKTASQSYEAMAREAIAGAKAFERQAVLIEETVARSVQASDERAISAERAYASFMSQSEGAIQRISETVKSLAYQPAAISVRYPEVSSVENQLHQAPESDSKQKPVLQPLIENENASLIRQPDQRHSARKSQSIVAGTKLETDPEPKPQSRPRAKDDETPLKSLKNEQATNGNGIGRGLFPWSQESDNEVKD